MPWPIKHGLAFHPLYRVWMSVKQKCTNPKSLVYKDYGGRGIKMHKPWERDVRRFVHYVMENLGERPSKRHSLDRRNNNGHYVPGNIRWATWEEQARNRRPVRCLGNYSDAELLQEIKKRGI
jgi:hypothetical protein